MNIQAILCSFILAGGAVMICVTTRTADDDGELKGKKAGDVVFGLGIALVAIGGLGYLFTIYEVIKRGHEKLSKGRMRKLEQQVKQRRETTVQKTPTHKATLIRTTELRADTLNEERF